MGLDFRLVDCACCWRAVARGRERFPCQWCAEAGCKLHQGQWLRGEECPRRTRNTRKSRKAVGSP